MPWVFSYSDLDPQTLEKILNGAPLCSLPATLSGYKITFKGRSRKWGGALATIEKSSKDFVYGSALLIPLRELELFDKHYKDFTRATLPIYLDATEDKIKAYTYISESTTYGMPSNEYTNTIMKNLKFFWGGKSLSDFGISTTIQKEENTEKILIKEKSEEKKHKRKVAK